jgi:dimethylargininase
MRIYNHALLRKPGKNFIHALAQDPHHAKPDYAKALDEFTHYAQTLEVMGLNLTICEADDRFPDGNFVEDTHLILRNVVLELNPGAPSRAGEPMSLAPFLPTTITKHILSKKYTIDGGDILEDGNNLYIGLSKRTQQAAIDELTSIVTPLGYQVHALPVPEGLHLKSGMTCLLPGHFIIQATFEPIVQQLKKTNTHIDYFIVPPEEYFAANVLPVNNKIMIPAGCPTTKAYIAKFYPSEAIYEVDTIEARKVDGALTCSSLLFAR